MKRLLLICALATLMGIGTPKPREGGTNVTVSWTHPTTNTDGSAIPASGNNALNFSRVQLGTCSDGKSGAVFGELLGEREVPFPATSATVALPVGRHCFRVYSANNFGTLSNASTVVEKTTTDPDPPNPPGTGIPPAELRVIESTAYEALPDFMNFFYLRGSTVGNAFIGAACDGSRVTADGFYAVRAPRAVVLLPGIVRPSAIVARCE